MTLRTQLWGQDPQTAADAPRWRVVSGLRVAVEESLDETLASALPRADMRSFASPRRCLRLRRRPAIQRVDGGYVAGSDPRKDGQAVGY
jgi:gamma-glutamyltranspeptidase / glutathione hydrolase